MKGVRVIACIQIVLSIVFVCIAFKVQQISTSMFDQYADSCQELAVAVRAHSTEGYQPFMQNIFSIKETLKESGVKIESLASIMGVAGAALQKYKGMQVRGIQLYPDSLVALGRSLQTTAGSLGQYGQWMVAQAGIIANYQDGVYDHTVQTMENAAEKLDQTACKLRRFETCRSPFVCCIVIIGFIFALNGVALLIIAKNSETH